MFQYAILITVVFTVFTKYMLHCIDLYDENPWENKAVYLLHLELITSRSLTSSCLLIVIRYTTQ